MSFYILLDTDEGEMQINASQILYSEVDSSSAAKIHLGDGSHHLAVAGTNLTSGFADAINVALQNAAKSSVGQGVVIPVVLSSGVSVQSLTVTLLP